MAIRLAFPTRLLLNQLTAKTVLKIVQKNAGETFASLSGHDARRFVKAVYHYRSGYITVFYCNECKSPAAGAPRKGYTARVHY